MVLRTLFALRAIQVADRLHNWAFPDEREYKIKEGFFLYHLKHCIKESIPDVEKYINQYIPNIERLKIERWNCRKDPQYSNYIISSTTLSIIPILAFRISYVFNYPGYFQASNKIVFILSVDLRNFHVTLNRV